MIVSKIENLSLSNRKGLAPSILEKKKIECCAECDYWRGTCVLNVNARAPGFLYLPTDKPCLEGTPRISKTIPLSFPR